MSSLANALGILPPAAAPIVTPPAAPPIALPLDVISIPRGPTPQPVDVRNKYPVPAGWTAVVPDEDSDDGDGRLTAHAQRNPFTPLIPAQQRKKNNAMSDATKQTLKLNKALNKEKKEVVAQDIIGIRDDLDQMCRSIAAKHGLTAEDVRKRVVYGNTNAGKVAKKPTLANGKVRYMAQQLNSELPCGEKATIKEIHEKIKADSTLSNLSPDHPLALQIMQDVTNSNALKTTGVRSSNKAALPDILGTYKRIENEIKGINARAGVRCIFMGVKGDGLDSSEPEMYGTSGALDFFDQIIKRHALDILVGFEAWSTTQSLAPKTTETRASLSHDASKAIQSGLLDITRLLKCKMNYADIDAIRAAHGVSLVGWPPGLKFGRPSDLNNTELRLLVDALRRKTCKWQSMPPAELEQLRTDRIQDPTSRRKERSDKGQTRKRRRADSEDDDTDTVASTHRKKKRAHRDNHDKATRKSKEKVPLKKGKRSKAAEGRRKAKSAEFIVSDDDTPSTDDDAPPTDDDTPPTDNEAPADGDEGDDEPTNSD